MQTLPRRTLSAKLRDNAVGAGMVLPYAIRGGRVRGIPPCHPAQPCILSEAKGFCFKRRFSAPASAFALRVLT